MVLIGFLVLAAALAFGIDIVWLNQSSISVEGFGQVVSTTPAALFVAGVVTGLAGALAVMLMRDGFVRRAVRRRESRVAEDDLRERLADRDRKAEAYEREVRRRDRSDRAVRADREVDLRDREPSRREEREATAEEHAHQGHVTTF